MNTFFVILAGLLRIAASRSLQIEQDDAATLLNVGETTAVRGWYMQSSAVVSANLTIFLKTDADMAGWHRVGSRGTIMASLLENNVYREQDLFFSDNLKTMVNVTQFDIPWLYRAEATLNPRPGHMILLKPNGISSKADLFVNGHMVASKDTLKGAYGGQKFDITAHVKKGNNIILIRAYPTNYFRDFAVGFGDWNPNPPDNGTGVWRDVMISQTRAVELEKPRVVTDYTGKSFKGPVTVTVKVLVRNHGLIGSKPVQGTIKGSLKKIEGSLRIPLLGAYILDPGEEKVVIMKAIIKSPKIWWPKIWGEQHLYSVDVAAYTGSSLSDRAEQRTFGIRHVTSALNSHNDRLFTVNGHFFQIRGAGYSSDMFLRFDKGKLEKQFALMLDMGLNTIRLEGKQEQPEFYDIADRMGIMIMAGWECCDKWEGWSYNEDATGEKWTDADYGTASRQMEHEAYMMQGHASILAFLVGSDYWPDNRASTIYVNKLREMDWDVPIIASAGVRGRPGNLEVSGLKMDGPYDWVPPNYWYGDKLGAAFGFGSELGSGVGTPEFSSLKKFLSQADITDLWRAPHKGLYHMSTEGSQFYDRGIFNKALHYRYGLPTSLSDYLLKAQISDYEATRSQYEAYSIKQNAERPATGLIYWMLNNAWPSLHWNLFDYYLKGAGSYYGAKIGSRSEHVAHEYGSTKNSIWIINHTIDKAGPRSVDIDLITKGGKCISSKVIKTTTSPTHSQQIATLDKVTSLKEPAFLKLVLRDESSSVLSRNVYWLSPTVDTLVWENSTWYHTPVSLYSNYTSLSDMKPAIVNVTIAASKDQVKVKLENLSKVPAFFIRLELQDEKGEDILPAFWDDDYVTLWPGEKYDVGVRWANGNIPRRLRISGVNIDQGREIAF